MIRGFNGDNTGGVIGTIHMLWELFNPDEMLVGVHNTSFHGKTIYISAVYSSATYSLWHTWIYIGKIFRCTEVLIYSHYWNLLYIIVFIVYIYEFYDRHIWELPGNYPVSAVVMVIHH